MRSFLYTYALVGAAIDLTAFGAPARAQTYTVTSITANAPAMGRLGAAGTNITTYRVSPTGAISVVSGNGGHVQANVTTVATVTVTCDTSGQCNSTDADVEITNQGTPTLRAGALTNFTVSMGTAVLVGTVSGTNPITFSLGAMGKTTPKTFFVGMDVPISGDDSGKATGAVTSGFSVAIAKHGSTPAGAKNGTLTATVFREITLTGPVGSLNFGTVVRPSSGSGSVIINASTGARSFTGSAINTATLTSGRATYTAGGEGGQTFTITAPAFNITNQSVGSNTLAVTPSLSIASPATLSGSAGSAGTLGFGVGGSLPLDSTTPTGFYTGTFNVTVAYN